MLVRRCVAIALDWLSLLVPEAGEREHWRARWFHSLPSYNAWLESRNLPPAVLREHLFRYLRDGAAEAFSSRWEMAAIRDEWRRKFRAPGVALFLPFALLAVGLWSSDMADRLRASFRPIAPAPVGDRLVTAVPERSFFGKTQGFTPRQFGLIRERASSYSTLSGYAIRWQTVAVPGGDVRLRRIAVAGPGVFSIFGLREGQAYAAGELGSKWVGRTLYTGGQRYRIAGVWPRNLRPALARPDFWIPQSTEQFDATMVAVLKRGVTHEAASAELRDLLLSAPARQGSGTPTAVVSLRHGQAGELGSLWSGFLALIAGLTAFAIWKAVRRRVWRTELFFLAKAIPLTSGIFLCSVATFGLLASGSASGPFFLFWLTGLGAVLGIWWARRDQELRCPHCLARMTMAVQIGTHGAALLEGVGDEVLCEYGHGSLWVPGAPAQAFGPGVWRGE